MSKDEFIQYANIIKTDLIAARSVMCGSKCIDNKRVCAYHLQQAVEKLIKIQIMLSNIQISSSIRKKYYVHEIDKLISFGKSQKIFLVVPKYITDHAVRISDWEAKSRYDYRFSVDIRSLRKTYEVSVVWLRDICKQNGVRLSLKMLPSTLD